MSPQTGLCRYTHMHLKWFMGTLVFSTLHCRDFSFFYFLFSFLRAHKKHKNANKRISYFFPLRCFLSAFFIFVRLFAFCAFAWLRFCAFYAFGAFGAYKIFSLKKKFKTALITSFLLLLSKLVNCLLFFEQFISFFITNSTQSLLGKLDTLPPEVLPLWARVLRDHHTSCRQLRPIQICNINF